MEPCIIPGCNNPRAAAWKRGLCQSCQTRAKKMIDVGKTTWEELERRGLALPKSSADNDPFTDAFNNTSNAE